MYSRRFFPADLLLAGMHMRMNGGAPRLSRNRLRVPIFTENSSGPFVLPAGPARERPSDSSDAPCACAPVVMLIASVHCGHFPTCMFSGQRARYPLDVDSVFFFVWFDSAGSHDSLDRSAPGLVLCRTARQYRLGVQLRDSPLAAPQRAFRLHKGTQVRRLSFLHNSWTRNAQDPVFVREFRNKLLTATDRIRS